MTFDTPLIWAMYKYEAYASEPQPIKTVHDFRQHCSKPGYICTKRFLFTDKFLGESGLSQLADVKAYPNHAELTTICGILRELQADEAFMGWRRECEYYKIDGCVAKWRNEPG